MEKRGGLVPVVAEVLGGILHRLADFDESGKVHRRRGLVFAAQVGNQVSVRDISAVKYRRELGRKFMAVAQIVNNDRGPAGLLERVHDMTADVTGPSGYQHGTSRELRHKISSYQRLFKESQDLRAKTRRERVKIPSPTWDRLGPSHFGNHYRRLWRYFEITQPGPYGWAKRIVNG